MRPKLIAVVLIVLLITLYIGYNILGPIRLTEETSSNGSDAADSATSGISILNTVARTANTSEEREIITLYLTLSLSAGSSEIEIGANGQDIMITVYTESGNRSNPFSEVTTLIDDDGDAELLSRGEILNLTIHLDQSQIGVGPGEEFSVRLMPPLVSGTIETYIAPIDLDERFIVLV